MFRMFEFIFWLGAERVDDDVCLLIVCLFMHFTQGARWHTMTIGINWQRGLLAT